MLLAREMEKREITREGSPKLPRPGKEEVRAVPKCTARGLAMSWIDIISYHK